MERDFNNVCEKFEVITSSNAHELEVLRKDLEDLKKKTREIKEKQDIVLKKTQNLIENKPIRF